MIFHLEKQIIQDINHKKSHNSIKENQTYSQRCQSINQLIQSSMTCLESGDTEPESEDESHELDAPYR